MCIYTNILKLFTCACVNGKTSLFVSLSQSHEAVVKLGACTGQQKGSCQNRERWSGTFHSGICLLRSHCNVLLTKRKFIRANARKH